MTGWPIDGGVVDPFVVLKNHPALADVPIPRDALRDPESLRVWPSTDLAGYLFRKDPDRDARESAARDLAAWLASLDRWQILQAQVPVPATAPDDVFEQLAEHCDRVFLALRLDPHDGMAGVRRLRRLAERYPGLWQRVLTRRAFMAEVLGIRLRPEVLPLSNLAGYLPPLWLSPQLAMRRA